MDDKQPMTEGFTISLVRWALAIRLLSLLIVLVLPLDTMQSSRVVVAVCLVAAWSLLWLSPRKGTLVLVQRHPIIAVGDVLLAVAVTALVGVDSPLVFVTLSTALVIGLLLPSLAAALTCSILVTSYLLLTLASLEPREGLFVVTTVLPATYVVLAALGGVTRHLHRQVLEEQARLAGYLARSAADNERARLAREMHDSVAKSLHGMALASATLPTWIDKDPETARRQAVAIQHGAEQASAEARSLLHSLRQEPGEGPLVEVLRGLVDEFDQAHEIVAELVVETVVDVDPMHRTEATKVVAEALENVARHAEADRVVVRLTAGAGTARIEVIDDGRGFDVHGEVADGHYGVQGMHERAKQVSGELHIVSRPGHGTRVTLTVPLTNATTREQPTEVPS